jgi:uncharacterized protein YegJ (DUF2314 family)
MRYILTMALAALGAVATPAAAQKLYNGPDHDPIVSFSASDEAMNAAKAKGQATLPEFFRHLAAPANDERDFSIKFDLLPESDAAEFIWASVVSRGEGMIVATLGNDPRDPRFKLGDEVRVREADVVDWSYFKGDVMQGGFTTRVILDSLPPEEGDQIRKSIGWDR